LEVEGVEDVACPVDDMKGHGELSFRGDEVREKQGFRPFRVRIDGEAIARLLERVIDAGSCERDYQNKRYEGSPRHQRCGKKIKTGQLVNMSTLTQITQFIK